MVEAQPCADCAVRDRALCGALSNRELTALNTLGRRRHVRQGETIIWGGDDNIVCGNLLSGVLKLSAGTVDGKEQTVALLYLADFFGHPYADKAQLSVTALSDAEVCLFPRGPFEQVLHDHGAMERLLLQRTMEALGQARDRMVMLARQSAEEKVAAFLLEMAHRSAGSACAATADGPATFDLPITRGQMAEILGLTIETVSRQLTRLKEDGLIALPSARGVTIRDAAALQARAGGR